MRGQLSTNRATALSVLGILLSACALCQLIEDPQAAHSSKLHQQHEQHSNERTLLEACKGKTKWSCTPGGGGAQQTIADSLHAAILSSNCTLLLSDAALYSCGGSLVQAALFQAVTGGACTRVSQQHASQPCNNSPSCEPFYHICFPLCLLLDHRV